MAEYSREQLHAEVACLVCVCVHSLHCDHVAVVLSTHKAREATKSTWPASRMTSWRAHLAHQVTSSKPLNHAHFRFDVKL